ncbi:MULTISPECIES: flagellin lysine-N-methylase [Clostridium]|uniref:flagellin lysine-N-methylase n=1 Tax=Clostridium TaxID=1485 RepID=UPI0013F6A57D|nr:MULTISPECIES: flagellin lysine-N-methylase [Clostridium]MBS4839501.1 flagellin lysine-N-methylase [Clostridium sp.]MCQ2018096.1 flagellin lysine-N-methylase [Clostridium butyricum]MCQ2021846.1 flagellin lysine-N-methylase [Clostridium butyricum]MDU1401547.1 flagellin lysine-N-methylase [Clostridium sp.]MDU4925502.1 flagellin lysine-N-methylase [Clostridium sp.]
MKMTKKLKIVMPDYFKQFKCIGGKCEDSCCIGWDIDVDEKTFRQYMKLDNEEFNTILAKNMQKNHECSNEFIDYGKVQLNKEKRCPLLNECNYCIIHSKLGEEYLSNTCSHFPRVLNKVDEDYEISLDVSCPEAARIVLENRSGFEFEKDDMELKKYIIAGEIDTNDEEYEDHPIKYFKEIREFCIRIIKNRKFDLSERLYILGDFLYEVEEKSCDDSEMICGFIESYNIHDVAKNYRRNKDNYIMQISLLNNIINSLEIYEETDSELFKKYTKETIDVFNIESPEQLEKDSNRYINAFTEYSENYIKENEYIFENYLVNFMYNNLFPYSESDSMFEGYMMLIMRYSLIRFYLVGKYLINNTESSEEIIKFIQVFSKTIEHDKNYMEEILDFLIENNFDNLDFTQMLI